MSMLRRVLLILCLALALPMGGGFTLPCQAPSAEPMPCCEQGMADCAESGMSMACCSLVPDGGTDRLLPSAQSLEGARIRWSVAPAALDTPFPALHSSVSPASAARCRSALPCVQPRVARTTVLLI